MFFSLLAYAQWHYTDALLLYIRILKNFWWFVVAYFSMPLLFKTLFVPYKRMIEERDGTMSSWLEASVINTLSRLVGFLIRLCLLIIGFLTLVFLTIGGITGYAVWLILPIIPSVLLLVGSLMIATELLLLV
jgi:hypothetical protein